MSRSLFLALLFFCSKNFADEEIPLDPNEAFVLEINEEKGSLFLRIGKSVYDFGKWCNERGPFVMKNGVALTMEFLCFCFLCQGDYESSLKLSSLLTLLGLSKKLYEKLRDLSEELGFPYYEFHRQEF